MIVAVVGGNGGVGKSTVALNLGYALDATVVDTDIAVPDLPGSDGPDLHDVLAGRASAADCVQRVGPVRILSAGGTLAGAHAADIDALDDVVETLHRRAGHVVLDCPAGLARDVGAAVAAADTTVLVITPDEPTLENATRARQLAVDLEAPPGAVAVNRVPDDGGETDTTRVEDALMAPAVSIDRHSAVAESLRTGRPVGDARPDAPAVEAFERLAQLVTETDGGNSE